MRFHQMNKLIVIMALFATLTACAYNPTTYQELRAYENAVSERANGL